MPKTSIDDLLRAIETVAFLKEAVDKQELSIAMIIDRLNKIELLLTFENKARESGVL